MLQQKKNGDINSRSAATIRTRYVCSFLLLILALILTGRFRHQSVEVAKTDAIINNLEQNISYIKDAETGIRGYAIMNDSVYLQPFLTSRSKVDSIYTILQTIISDTQQRKDLSKLGRLIEKRYQVFNNALDTLKKYHHDLSYFSRNKANSGRKSMDSLRVQVSKMQYYEAGLMKTKQLELSNSYTIITLINVAALLIGIGLAFFTFITFNKENKARGEADQKAADYRKRLEARVVELRTANLELTTLRSNEKFASTGRIARTIAHEVRNPLTNINLATEHLQEEVAAIDGSEMMLDMIRRNSKRIQQLIADLLNSTRFAELHFEKVAVHTLLDQTLEQAQDRLDLNQVRVIKIYDPMVPELFIDGEKIKLAFLNIILNAVEEMAIGKGILTAKTSTSEQYCIISITDNGPGMSPETLLRLFEPYFTQKEKGNGLGLTNTQNIILNHKGLLNVESEPGNGATFTIRLPYTFSG